MTTTIGCDPELFVVNVNNKFISSIGKFGGSKIAPAPIGHNCYVQEDNVAVEFNIPPASSKEQFLASINFSLEELHKRAEKMHLQLAIVPSARFDNDQLRSPKAKVFGCDPDKNAWTLTQNHPPRCADKRLRSAGGHVHVGCKKFLAFDIARAMDLFLGVPFIVVDDNLERRRLYGQAGAYREKEYGMEYRTLSNVWLKSDKLKEWVFDQTHAAIDFLELGNILTFNDGKDIQNCINTPDFSLMQELVKQYHLVPAPMET